VSYRLIALFDTLPPEAQVIVHHHEALLKGGQLRLRGLDADEEARAAEEVAAPPSPLRALIFTARSREWKDKLDAYNPRFERLESNGDQKTVAYSRWLRGRPVQDAGEDAGEDVPRDAFGLDRDLRNDATKILSRKTVFLVPDYKPRSCTNQSELEQVVTSIAVELSGYLDSAKDDVGFLRRRGPESTRNGDDPGVMRAIVRKLFTKSCKVLEKGPDFYNKEGPLLMDGPTGTGKSMAAELIALTEGKQFVNINMAAVTETLLEGHMRGHVKGAYTDAVSEEDGWFAKSHGGVLFLDEFQNASLVSQTQLLDLLDPVSNDVFINRLGESNRRRFNVKVIMATNRPVGELLSEGKLRADLFYRIRDVIKLRTFSDVLNSAETPMERMAIVRRLCYIYRWKSSPYGGVGGFAYDADYAPLFPAVEESVAEPIQNFQWEGNYRQFERVISDIYWRNDTEGLNRIDGSVVQDQLEVERRRLGSESLPVCADTHLRTVENLLLEHQFNIGKTVEALNPLKFSLGSRASLRSYLRENRDSLRPEIRRDSRIASFLRGKQ